MVAVARFFFLLVALPTAHQALGARDASSAAANPVRKVITLLQNMQKKVAADAEREEKLYAEYKCYCTHSNGDLTAAIQGADTKIPQVEKQIEEAVAQKAQLEQELKQHGVDRKAAQQSLADATALREKEATGFAGVKTELDENIAAISAATTAISKGMAGGFLQTGAAVALRKVLLARASMVEQDRQEVIAFLSGTQFAGYSPVSSEVLGILKQLQEDMEAELSEHIKTEKDAIATFESLATAKKKEVAALTAAIEEKTERVGVLGVSVVTMKNDLTGTEQALLEDKQYLADLEKSCGTQDAEWEERKRMQAEELVAIAETIKILNDDDALELFKSTLPSNGASASASFVQTRKRASILHALTLLRAASASSHRPEIDLVALAVKGKKVDFSKVVQMIDSMVAVLKGEQTDDDSKREYCGHQLDKTEDKKKELEHTLSTTENAVAEAESSVATLKDEIKALEAGIKALDKDVLEASDQRKAEHAEFTELMASNTAAKELLGMAKNRLNQFYNPKLYKPPKKAERTEAERISDNFNGEASPNAASSFVQLVRHTEAPAPPPETLGAYTKKTEESGGVIRMIDLLIQDLDKEMTEAQTGEEGAQADYEKVMSDAAKKRAEDTNQLNQKTSVQAALESDIVTHKETVAATGKELLATAKYMASVHSECDWLLQYYDVRKEARAIEMDNLNQAKAVLQGADLSLL
eukprot:NODE_2398_length_2220_cov_2.874343.p1 GENE.NODE_2398_length_2220_cov_2.874343~~NODE_2398_length_2220_cov_2.874343.p1  ORF type:complete len:702 (+),score=231.85 NODE_2398_length_2220_cov_2.874343:114-2219(+)